LTVVENILETFCIVIYISSFIFALLCVHIARLKPECNSVCCLYYIRVASFVLKYKTNN